MKVWCVRAEYGMYSTHFVSGGYIAIGYGIAESLEAVSTRDGIEAIYRKTHPDESSNLVIGQQVGQITRFLLDIKPGDYVITPSADTEWLHYGLVKDLAYWFEAKPTDGCPYRNRRGVDWINEKISRSSFSVPFQNTIRSSLTVFGISQADEFLSKIEAVGYQPRPKEVAYDHHNTVLDRVLELNDKEFEILVGHLLTAIGFEESEVVGKSGDGGVDATGTLNVSNLAKVKIYVQAKRYKRGQKISANVVKQLRTAIPVGGQGAFITTAEFQSAATVVAVESGFARIGLINGRQLVDLLVEHWQDIPEEFRSLLGLRIGLVLN
jgi:predicted Mrr-cat superfamily restriction endonuclease